MENKNKKLAIILSSIALLFICCLITLFTIIIFNFNNIKQFVYNASNPITETTVVAIQEKPITEIESVDYGYLFEPFWQSIELIQEEFVDQPVDIQKMADAATDSLTLLAIDNNQKLPDLTTEQLTEAESIAKIARTPKDLQSNFTEFWQTWQQIINTGIVETYSYNDLMEYALTSAVASLEDRYTEFMTEEQYQALFNQMNGENYEGIGAWVDTSGEYLMIQSPMRNSPAEKAGLKAMDLIIAINGEDMTGIDPEAARQNVLGPAGSELTLTIKRASQEPFDVTLTRGAIKSPSVYSEIIERDGLTISHIQISSFGEDTHDLLRLELEDLIAQNMDGIIVDLRYNGGGYVHTAVAIASEFLSEDEIFYQIDSTDHKSISYNTGEGIAHDIPLVILVNESSASASEIFTGAIKDYQRAPIVGTTTFGKGLVQTPYTLKDGRGVIKVTTAHWYTPFGSLIQGTGIDPDYPVELTEDDIANSFDAQLEKAIELLLK